MLFDLDDNNLHPCERQSLTHWSQLFRLSFAQDIDKKRGIDSQSESTNSSKIVKEGVASLDYKGIKGVSVGYRREDQREFFETRLDSSGGNPVPNYPITLNIDNTDNNKENQYYCDGVPSHVIDHKIAAAEPPLPPPPSTSTSSSSFESSKSSVHLSKSISHNECVKGLFSILSKVAAVSIAAIANVLAIDPRSLIDLTDIDPDALEYKRHVNNTAKTSNENENENEKNVEGVKNVKLLHPKIDEDELSSSLLRICNYPVGLHSTNTDTDLSIAFGSHTDTSFVTLGLCSDIPGLEIYDILERKWINAEEVATDITKHTGIFMDDTNVRPTTVALVVFVGELAQIFSKHVFTAAVHRVRSSYPAHVPAPPLYMSPSSFEVGSCTLSTSTCQNITQTSRISCPFIVRGRNKAIVSITTNPSYNHPPLLQRNFHKDKADHNNTDTDTFIGTDIGTDTPTIQDDNDIAMVPVSQRVGDFDEMSMKLIHKILDMKRARCANTQRNEHDEWVLCSFPEKCPIQWGKDCDIQDKGSNTEA